MLEQLQSAFLAAIRGTQAGPALGASAIAPERSWQIYRRNYLETHIAALKDSYSTVCALVGERYFRQLAAGFVGQSDSKDGDLNLYGADFPAYLDGAAGARELPYLADIARLDWACFGLFRAGGQPDDGWLARLLALAPDRWPAVRAVSAGVRISSDFPIFSIWQLAGGAPGTVDLGQGGQTVLVTHPGHVQVSALDPGEDAFTLHWLGGATLEQALDGALQQDPGFAIGPLLTRLAAIGAIQSIESTP